MTALAATGTLIRGIARRDRVRVAVWVVAIAGVVFLVASAEKGIYPTPADLRTAAAALNDNPAQIAINGPAQGLDSLGGMVAFELWKIGLVGIALMSLFMVSRHTRAEEESGRTELVRSMAVGRHASLTAALVVAVGMNLLVGVAVAAALIAQELHWEGSLMLGASFAALGLAFCGVAAVATQVSENSRVVNGIGGAVFAVFFVIRAVGDMGDGTLSWLSPLGWVQAARPFAGERWWPLLLPVGFTALLVVIGVALESRRDLGAGLVPPRPGPPIASTRLARPAGLALRLQRGSLIGWSIGLFLGGLALGAIAAEIDDLVVGNENLSDVLLQGGGSPIDSFFASFLVLLAMICSVFGIQSVQRLQGEEAAARAEPVLATGVSRLRWAGGQLAVALAGSATVLAAAGLGAGVAQWLVSGDLSEIPRLLGSALVYTPAVWLLVGITFTLFGLAPRAVPAAWTALTFFFIVALLGHLLELPDWLSDLSPFQHTPRVPAADLTAAPLVILTALAAGLIVFGLATFRRRDLG